MRWTEEQLLAHQVKQKNKVEVLKKEIADDGLERELDTKIAKYIKDNGLYGFHDRSRRVNEKGILDWTIALPNGRVIFIENKSKNGKWSEEQKLNRVKLLGLGHKVYECRSYKRFLEIIEGLKNVPI